MTTDEQTFAHERRAFWLRQAEACRRDLPELVPLCEQFAAEWTAWIEHPPLPAILERAGGT